MFTYENYELLIIDIFKCLLIFTDPIDLFNYICSATQLVVTVN